ncbi:MAG: hypothetical protein IPL19_09325 [Sandaracinaceae bacterium]|nr:hypothetical protein [Sandaracinaceae bacterium]MBK7775366.1 hypothetical protein [Sandaracinaceae bacterium]MBK8408168.1 hypothetical protein [Sandaracinaceae bacterium]MBP7683303.1 hypothetical protein [Deltaproteobacteria bacterium]
MSGRWKSWLLLGSFLSLGGSFMGCGGGDTTADQGPRDMGRDTGADEDGAVTCQGDTSSVMVLACDRADLFMSVVNMAAGTVTLTNPTDTDIDLDAGSYQFCQGPGRYGAPPAGVVPAGGSLTVAVPGSITLDPANGTLALYSAGTFTTRDAMLDYVCWGNGGGVPRLNVAQATGTDGTVLWDDCGCVPLAGATSVHLMNGTTGNAAESYQTSAVAFTCTQTVADAGVDAGPPMVLECGRDHLIIESVNTQTEEITLYNPTDTAITTTGDYQLCQGPSNYAAVPALTIAAFGRMTFAAPSAIDLGANQTVALYSSSSFGTRDAMVDYMCWGTGGTRPRLTEARTVGTDGTVLWDNGGCPAANTNDIVYRVPSTEGNTAADYTTTAPGTAIDCAPITG